MSERELRIAYLVLAHANPRHLRRLAASVAADGAVMYVHVDQKSESEGFLAPSGADVRFTSTRIPVYWGEYSMVEAILVLIAEALAAREEYDYFVLLSGADYPLRDAKYIQQFFARNRGTQFISMARIPTAAAGLPLTKVNRIAVPSSQPLKRAAMKISARVGLAERDHQRYLGGLTPFGGSTWWALTRDACGHIVDFAARNRAVCEFFRYTYSSDEMFFHTILGNAERARYSFRRSLVFDDWSSGGVHPATLNEEHLSWFESQEEIIVEDAFGRGELLFARKFSDATCALTDRVDRMIALKSSVCGCRVSTRSDHQ